MGSTVLKDKISTDFHDETNELVRKVAKLVAEVSGNILEEKQFSMVENRLKKRMMSLNIQTPNEYLEFLKNNKDKELVELVGLLTTHHTFFFREFVHFEYLQKQLPNLVENVKKRGDKTLRIWSAACSRGHEPYSLALFFKYHLATIDPSIKFEILATDIDEKSVEVAQNGVYHEREIKAIPIQYMSNYFVRGKGDISEFLKLKKI